jgi:hypothetical protein
MLLKMMFRRLMRMLFGVGQVSMRHMRVMCSPVVIASLVMLGSFRMMVSRLLVMMGSLLVMLNRLF